MATVRMAANAAMRFCGYFSIPAIDAFPVLTAGPRFAVKHPPVEAEAQAGGEGYQEPVFGMEAQGSAAASGSPFWRISNEMPSGERTKAILPSRGGRLMVTPLSISLRQKS